MLSAGGDPHRLRLQTRCAALRAIAPFKQSPLVEKVFAIHQQQLEREAGVFDCPLTCVRLASYCVAQRKKG